MRTVLQDVKQSRNRIVFSVARAYYAPYTTTMSKPKGAAPHTTVIYKYPVQIDDEFALELPDGAQVLTVAMQNGEPWLWAMVKTGSPAKTRWFRIIGTGNPIDDAAQLAFVGTFQMRGGTMVWHLFEKKAETALAVRS